MCGPSVNDVRVSCTELKNRLMHSGESCGVDAMVACVRVNGAGVKSSIRPLSVREPVMWSARRAGG